MFVEQTELLDIPGIDVVVRDATAADLPGLLRLLADDPHGAVRDAPLHTDPCPYRVAFEAIDRDPAHRLLVCEHAGNIIAMLQLSFIPGLSRRGSLRAQIEAVRTAADHRGRGVGSGFISWAINHARANGCTLVQLTTDKSRVDAQRFYARLGFEASHEGMKLEL
ncbi:MAG: GNAT family N-acetyltransferase [Micrococcaceae bacterium]|nr:GNAT family N-acetyltransferase [Micrococcaceae bacterium]